MVTFSNRLDRIYAALGDPTRRAIVERLRGGDATVGELAHPFAMSRPAISKHLRVLERAGLVRRAKEGRMSRCRLDASHLYDAAEWLAQYRTFWETQLDRLGQFVDGEGADTFETEEDERWRRQSSRP